MIAQLAFLTLVLATCSAMLAMPRRLSEVFGLREATPAQVRTTGALGLFWVGLAFLSDRKLGPLSGSWLALAQLARHYVGGGIIGFLLGIHVAGAAPRGDARAGPEA